MIDISKWIDEGNISIKSKNTKRKRLVYSIDQISGDVSIYYKDIKIGYRQGYRLIWIQKAIRYIVDKIVYPDNFNPYQISNNKKIVNEYKYEDGRLMIENGVLDSDRLRDIIRLDNKCAANGCNRVGSKFLVSIYYDGSIHVDLYSDDNTLMTIDHIIPKSKGGANSIDNYQMMCQPHNNDKGNIYENLNLFTKTKLIYRDMTSKKFESIDITPEKALSVKDKFIKRLEEYKNFIVLNYNSIDSIDINTMMQDFTKKFGQEIVSLFNIEAFLRKINQILQLTNKKGTKHLLGKRDIKLEFSQYYISLDNRIKMLDPQDKSDHFDEIEGEGSVISRRQYEKEKFRIQVELLKLQEWVQKTNSKVCIVFEGRDAAGKGSTIKRFTEYLNPKGFRVVALGIPTEEEKKNWFARYEKYLPKSGEIVFFDRSWYNRAVVEPSLGYCTEDQYRDFMDNVNDWEESLVNEGIILIKFWFSITKEKQLQRFEIRQKSPLKYWKFSPNDAKVSEKWDVITKFKNQMFEKTSTPIAPWVIINSNDKKIGRLNAMRYVLNVIDYDDKDDTICQYYPEVVNVLI